MTSHGEWTQSVACVWITVDVCMLSAVLLFIGCFIHASVMSMTLVCECLM